MQTKRDELKKERVGSGSSISLATHLASTCALRMPRIAQEDTTMAEPDSPSTSAALAACQFPSVKTDAPLVDSYTFHSVDKKVAASAKGKEVEQPVIEGEWMLGVDEAGRGPVLGEFTRFLS